MEEERELVGFFCEGIFVGNCIFVVFLSEWSQEESKSLNLLGRYG